MFYIVKNLHLVIFFCYYEIKILLLNNYRLVGLENEFNQKNSFEKILYYFLF